MNISERQSIDINLQTIQYQRSNGNTWLATVLNNEDYDRFQEIRGKIEGLMNRISTQTTFGAKKITLRKLEECHAELETIRSCAFKNLSLEEERKVSAVQEEETPLSLDALSLDSKPKEIDEIPKRTLTESEFSQLLEKIRMNCITLDEMRNLEIDRLPRDAKIFKALPSKIYSILYGETVKDAFLTFDSMTYHEKFYMKDVLDYLDDYGDQELKDILNDPSQEIRPEARDIYLKALAMTKEEREAMKRVVREDYKINQEELSKKTDYDLFEIAKAMRMHKIYQTRMEKDPVQTIIQRYEDLKSSFFTYQDPAIQQSLSWMSLEVENVLSLEQKLNQIQSIKNSIKDLQEDQYQLLMKQIEHVENKLYPYAYLTDKRYC